MTSDRRSQSITVSAKTVAEAIAEAEQRLGLRQDEIDITVISEGSKGFLGMGGENARILAMPKAILSRKITEAPRSTVRRTEQSAAPARPADEPVIEHSAPVVDRTAPVAEAQYTAEPAAATADVAAEAPILSTVDVTESEDGADAQQMQNRPDPVQVAQEAVDVVRELLVRMSIDALATVRSTGNPVVIDITGSDLGLLIGRHGDTLSSLQYLVNAIVGKRVNRWCKVVIDVEQYRLRREDTLRSLANRQAARVRQSRREIALDPMPAAERRVIHVTLQNSPWVVTNSVGEEPNRRVVIAPRQGSR